MRLLEPNAAGEALVARGLDGRMREDAIAMRGRTGRGRLVRRVLVMADIVGLVTAFGVARLLFASDSRNDLVFPGVEFAIFAVTLPVWVMLAGLYGLYARDGERAEHSTADDVFRVVNLVTLGTWTMYVLGRATDLANPQLARAVAFWLAAIVLVVGARAIVRALVRSDDAYVQRALIVGAGDVGQLVARKISQHPEYAIELVGFVDDDPKAARADVDVSMLGGIADLGELVDEHRIDRVIVAFSGEPDDRTLALVRLLPLDDVIVDVVPRLFELISPRSSLHSIEGLPLVCLPPTHLSRPALVAKRFIDIVGALVILLFASPLFAAVAIAIKLDSSGPVFFRQARLGYGMRPFTLLKFRTMRLDTDDEMHREYIRSTMSSRAELGESGKYKLEMSDSVTRVGAWLRRTSLDELPQLVNVLKGEMSLVGPRPCIAYETENFRAYHFERFLVPQGMTGLWQVAARSSSTFGEALDMDVAYARGWSLGLDLRLLFRTPFAILRQRKVTA